MAEYLLVLEETSGGHDHFTRHTIEANSRQMVKYHFHRTLKDMGYHDTQFNKHCLEGHKGLLAEIHEIRRLDRDEYEILSRYMPSWMKV